MKRRIIKQGHNTLTVTLPSEWTRRLNLMQGDEIDVIENDDMLVLNGPQKTDARCCLIDITDFTVPLLWRYFQSAYRSGCDEIKVVFDPGKKEYEDAFHYYTTQFAYTHLGEKVPAKPAIAMIQEVVNRFIGVDIIESGKGYCIIKEMGEVSAKEFDNSLRRIFLVIFELFDRLLEAMDHDELKQSTLCKEVHAIDLNIDKFVDYCARILNKINGRFPDRKKQLIFSSLFTLELVGDEFKYLAKHLAFSSKPVQECIPMLRMVREHFNLYYQLYYKFDREIAIDWGRHDVAIYSESARIKEKLKGESRSIMRHVMLISKFTMSLVELRIQMEF